MSHWHSTGNTGISRFGFGMEPVNKEKERAQKPGPEGLELGHSDRRDGGRTCRTERSRRLCVTGMPEPSPARTRVLRVCSARQADVGPPLDPGIQGRCLLLPLVPPEGLEGASQNGAGRRPLEQLR